MIKYTAGTSLGVLKNEPSDQYQAIITSPPFWGLRDYGTGSWVGGDPNCPHKRLTKIKNDNDNTGHLGMYRQGHVVADAIYKTTCPCGANRIDEQLGLEETPAQYVNKLKEVFSECRRVLKKDGVLFLNLGDTYAHQANKAHNIKAKEIYGLPWKVAFALQENGWYLRQEIIWRKLNPMPEPVKDRFTRSHEYIFMFTKNKKYYFDNMAIKEPTSDGKALRQKRSVWETPVASSGKFHFAVFPEELILPCLLSATKENDLVLDPFAGSGTVGVVSKKNNRSCHLIDLNNNYIEKAKARINKITTTENLDLFQG
tara:strand:- start:940 stop:1878 length:939 start_codon:yes stop_codon:yes gene_type:complete